MPDTMRAVDIKGGKGDRSALFINPDIPTPTASAHEAIVKVHAFGINRMDILQRRGQYPLPPNVSTILGVEFSGTIESLGDAAGGGSASFRVGDEVFGLAYGGAYAERIAVNTKMLLHKPKSLTHVQCAALPEVWITATQALHMVLGFAKGKSILWHAGASGVSIAGIQLSRAAGASKVFATAGTDDKCKFVVDQVGATAAFNYKTQDWAQQVKEATDGQGVDFIVDFVGADYFQKNLDAAARDCRIVMLGLMSGAKVPDANLAPILLKRIRVEGSTLRSRDPEYQGKLRDKLESYMPQFESGEFKIVVDKVMPWDKIQEAHQHMEEAKNSGKIICTIIE